MSLCRGSGTTPERPEHVQRAKETFDTLEHQKSETAEMLWSAVIYRQISARTARRIRLIPSDTRGDIDKVLPTDLPPNLSPPALQGNTNIKAVGVVAPEWLCFFD